MKLGLLLSGHFNEKWALARQIGVRHVVAKLAPELTGMNPPWDHATLVHFQSAFADAGMELAGLEGDQFDMSRIKLGLPGRDEDLDRYRQMVTNMGRLGVDLLCLNFMVGLGWLRTSTTTPGRGGALCTTYDHEAMKRAPLTSAGEISQEQVWENLKYFLDAVVPVAKAEGVRLAFHPDDPPVSPLRGIGRVLSTVAGYHRLYEMGPPEVVGCTFCQATFSIMEDVTDLSAAARDLAQNGRLFFVHIRQVAGDRWSFVERFHDEGPVDLRKMLALYHELGFSGVIRPDHTPTMAGEVHFDPSQGALASGYEMKGRLFAIGYLKGLLEGQGIAYE